MYLTPGNYYRHRYGGLYQLVSSRAAESTVDNTMHIVYAHIYPFEQKLWVRPLAEWLDGRFTELQPAEVDAILVRNRDDLKAEITANKTLAKSK